MSTTFKIALFFFLLLILAGLFFGLARDLYSTERGVVRGAIVEVAPSRAHNKQPGVEPPKLTVRLADGAVVSVATQLTDGLAAGQEIDITEMVMPWGQVWYKRRE